MSTLDGFSSEPVAVLTKMLDGERSRWLRSMSCKARRSGSPYFLSRSERSPAGGGALSEVSACSDSPSLDPSRNPIHTHFVVDLYTRTIRRLGVGSLSLYSVA